MPTYTPHTAAQRQIDEKSSIKKSRNKDPWFQTGFHAKGNNNF